MPTGRSSTKSHRPTSGKRKARRSSFPSEAAQRRAWRREVNYFESIRAKLSRDPKYRGKFVAVLENKIIDVDDDRFTLFHRISAAFPNKVVLIEQATRQPRRVELPSVEICR